MEVTLDIRNDDVVIVEAVFNQLLQWICELNFNLEMLPRFELFEQAEINTDQVERDTKLHSMGVRFSKSYFEREYGFENGDIEIQAVENTEKTAKAAEFAESHLKGLHPIADGIYGAYNRGRLQQHLDLADVMPYWEYVHNDNAHPRPHHERHFVMIKITLNDLKAQQQLKTIALQFKQPRKLYGVFGETLMKIHKER